MRHAAREADRARSCENVTAIVPAPAQRRRFMRRMPLRKVARWLIETADALEPNASKTKAKWSAK
jgi:hypothetical protein